MKSNFFKTTALATLAILLVNFVNAQNSGYYSPGYRYVVQQQANSGQYNVCVNTPTQHQYTQSNGWQAGGGYGYKGANVNGSYNSQYQNQGSYSVNQYQCGQGYRPQQGQQFYINYGYGNQTQPVPYNSYYNVRRRP